MVSLKDRKSLVITLLMPAVLTTILGFAFSGVMGGSASIGEAKIAVVEMGSRQEDMARIKKAIEDAAARGLIKEELRDEILDLVPETDFQDILYTEVLGNSEVKKFLTYEIMDRDKAIQALERGEITAVVVIPEKFLYNTFLNLAMPFKNPVEIEVIKHPNYTLKGGMVEGILRGFTDALAAGIIAKNTLLEAAIENNVGEKAYEGLESITRDIFNVRVREIDFRRTTEEGRKPISSFQYYAVGMAVMFILYAASDGAHYAIDEVRNSTYSRVLLANAGLFRIFASRFISTTLFTLIQVTILMLYSKLAFRIEWGPPSGVMPLTMLLAVAIGGLSVLLSSINLRLKDNRASLVFQAVFIQFSALVGGSFFPVGSVPIMKAIGGMTVNGAALEGYLKLMRGYQLSDIAGVLSTLAVVTAVCFTAGTYIASGVRE
ncbi:MAG: hypothetical protein HPY66_0590 [Firmicutes bacterium]|nr:hypothetical protein [Bacillota bacterium]